MMRFHMNEKTGRSAPCNAEVGNCPLGGESGETNHYDTLEKAQEAATALMVERHGVVSTLSRKERQTGTAGFRDLTSDKQYENLKGGFPKISGARLLFHDKEHMVIPVAPFGRLGVVDEEGNDKTGEFISFVSSYSLIGGPDNDQFRKEAEVAVAQNDYIEARDEFYGSQFETEYMLEEGMLSQFAVEKDEKSFLIGYLRSDSYFEIKPDGKGDITVEKVTNDPQISSNTENNLEQNIKSYGKDKWLKIFETYETSENLRKVLKEKQHEAEYTRTEG